MDGEGKTGRIGSKMTSAGLLDGRHLHLSAINSAIDDAHFVAGATGLAEQRLVCVLAVDVAGCSRLMRADEGRHRTFKIIHLTSCVWGKSGH
jgi:hypothetical protein